MADMMNSEAGGVLGGGGYVSDTDTAGFEADVINASAIQSTRARL